MLALAHALYPILPDRPSTADPGANSQFYDILTPCLAPY